MMSHMTKEESVTRLNLTKGDHAAVMVNNLGGTSVLELNVVVKEVLDWLSKYLHRVLTNLSTSA